MINCLGWSSREQIAHMSIRLSNVEDNEPQQGVIKVPEGGVLAEAGVQAHGQGRAFVSLATCAPGWQTTDDQLQAVDPGLDGWCDAGSYRARVSYIHEHYVGPESARGDFRDISPRWPTNFFTFGSVRI